MDLLGTPKVIHYFYSETKTKKIFILVKFYRNGVRPENKIILNNKYFTDNY